jgi:GT2 family glycosyltransferase
VRVGLLMRSDRPFISVVIPTCHRPRQLADCLRALAEADYPRDCFEVIVVDDGGGIPLEETLAPFRGALELSLLQRGREGPSRARNAGAARAKGDLLVFTGDDCVPGADWMRTLADRFAGKPDCAFGGQIVNALPGNSFSTASHLLLMYLYGHYNSCPDAARFFTPNNLAIPTERFRSIGGFDASFVAPAGEDREFCDRWLHSGYAMTYAPEVTVAHAHPLTFRGFCRQQFLYGRGTFRHRLIQAKRARTRMAIEPARFYLDLVRYPFTLPQEKKKRMAVLLGISQVANALGFFWESATRNRQKPATTVG